MSDFAAIANQFVEFYYKQFDSDRKGLATLYRDSSMLTFENAPIQGVAGIVDKLSNLPFQKCEHQTTTVNAQPMDTSLSGILVFVTGALMMDEERRPMGYSQTFHLKQEASGNWYIQNDMFNLIYSAS